MAFKSSVSFHTVCEFCRSTLVRHGGDLENLGRMADLLEDASPIQLGTEGVYRGAHFAVIGRIQLRYAAGVWNEWHILTDDQRSGWLSDASGEYVISFLKPPGRTLPPFSELLTDTAIIIADQEFVVTNKEDAMCIAGEGELPFAFGAGHAAPVADLRGMAIAPGTVDVDARMNARAAAVFASIDYSESPPLYFVGESLPFAALKFANLRTTTKADRPAGEVLALQCPCCGGPISLHDKAVQSVACPSCLTILDAENASLKILQRVTSTEHIEPTIALGSIGRFEDKAWTAIGFQQRAVTTDGIVYRWQEYLLHHAQEGFRWLIENDGHWNWVSPLAAPPRYQVGEPSVQFGGSKFTRFASGLAETCYVIGEFNWKVSVGEVWDSTDFIAPPKMLSREASSNETAWSAGDYLPPESVQAAFSLKALPPAKGIGANQPNPRRDSHRRTFSYFWKFLLIATVAQLVWFFILGSHTLLEQTVVFTPSATDPVATKTFKLDQPARNIVLRHKTDIDNSWVGMTMTLVEKNSGQTWAAQSELSYWQGVDDGESWSEGSKEKELVFRNLPAGEYYFVIDPEISDEKPVSVADRIRVVRNQATWSNYIFLFIFLAAFPLLSRTRVASFESGRWSNADFTASGTEVTVSNNDSDDDSGGDD